MNFKRRDRKMRERKGGDCLRNWNFSVYCTVHKDKAIVFVYTIELIVCDSDKNSPYGSYAHMLILHIHTYSYIFTHIHTYQSLNSIQYIQLNNAILPHPSPISPASGPNFPSRSPPQLAMFLPLAAGTSPPPRKVRVP